MNSINSKDQGAKNPQQINLKKKQGGKHLKSEQKDESVAYTSLLSAAKSAIADATKSVVVAQEHEVAEKKVPNNVDENKFAATHEPVVNGDTNKNQSATDNPDEDHGQVEDLASKKSHTQEEAIYKVKELVKKLSTITEYHLGLGMKIQKMLGSYYFDHPPLREMVGDTLATDGYAASSMKMLKALNTLGIFKNDAIWFPTYYGYNTMWNFSDSSPDLAKNLAEADAVRMLTLNLSHKPYLSNMHSKNVLYLLKASLSILHNMARNPETKFYFKEHKATEVLKPFFTMEDEMLKALAMLTTAYIVNEEENADLIDDTGTIKCILGWIENALDSPKNRFRGFTPHELVEGLDRLAVNDSNKLKIVTEGALDLFHQMLKLDSLNDQRSASAILWTLSFDSSVREKIMNHTELVKTMDLLLESEYSDVKKNISGAFWLIREEKESLQRGRETESTKAHIFISYCWSDQANVLKIRDYLQKNGYNVWIDVDFMEGSTLEAMADGIENAALVLVVMSEKYKQSPNCRTEAEYTFQLRKDYIPIMMQPRYRPDGWLGLILGAKLYIDFSGKLTFERASQGLVKELRGRGQRDKKSTDVTDSGITSETSIVPSTYFPSNTPANTHKPKTVLTKDGVSKWLLSNNLGHVAPGFSSIDGKMLLQMINLRHEAPEYFYQSLEAKFKLTFQDILRLMEAMDKIA